MVCGGLVALISTAVWQSGNTELQVTSEVLRHCLHCLHCCGLHQCCCLPVLLFPLPCCFFHCCFFHCCRYFHRAACLAAAVFPSSAANDFTVMLVCIAVIFPAVAIHCCSLDVQLGWANGLLAGLQLGRRALRDTSCHRPFRRGADEVTRISHSHIQLLGASSLWALSRLSRLFGHSAHI